MFGQPLPLGVAGLCEPLDVLVRAPVELAGLAERLSAFLPSGLRAVQAVLPQRDLKEIAWAAYETSMPASCAAAFESFWGQSSVVTLKKSKRGAREIDLKQLAARMETQPGPDMLVVRYMLPCSSGRLGRSGPAGRCVCGLCRPDAADVAYPDRLLRRGFFTLPVTPGAGIKRAGGAVAIPTYLYLAARLLMPALRDTESKSVFRRGAWSLRKQDRNFTFLSCFVAPKPVCTV